MAPPAITWSLSAASVSQCQPSGYVFPAAQCTDFRTSYSILIKKKKAALHSGRNIKQEVEMVEVELERGRSWSQGKGFTKLKAELQKEDGGQDRTN